jgi:type IX secretion system substrate protein
METKTNINQMQHVLSTEACFGKSLHKNNFDFNLKQKIWLSCLVMLFTLITKAQYAPTVQWQNESWLSWGTSGNWIPQKSYQEDWWYDHCNAYTGTTFTGYMACGYSDLQETYDETANYNATYGQGCTKSIYNINEYSYATGDNNCGEWQIPAMPSTGLPRATFGFNNPNGSSAWVNFTNCNGYYNRITQLSAGANAGKFIAVGASASTRQKNVAPTNGTPLYVNPNQTFISANTNPYFTYSNVFTSTYPQTNGNHIDIAMFDINGVVSYNYIYCPPQFLGTSNFTSTSNTQYQQAYQAQGEAFDVMQDPYNTGDIIVVGNAYDVTSYPTITNKAFIMRLDNNMNLLNFSFINSNPSIARAVKPITISGVNYYAVSYQLFNVSTTVNTEVNIDLINPTNFATVSSSQIIPSGAANMMNANCWDLEVAIDPLNPSVSQIIAPVINNCNVCAYAGDNKGQLQIFLFTPPTSGLTHALTAQSITLPQVEAFDLKARLCPITPSFGAVTDFGLVSTVKVTPWLSAGYGCSPPSWEPQPYNSAIPCSGGADYGAGYWNSNTYVARLHYNGTSVAKLWDTNFDCNDPQSCEFPASMLDANYPDAGANVKRQECVYGISEAPDGGLVISGNSSNNYDDSYLVKLYPDCESNAGYDISDPSGTINLTTNTHWNYDHVVIGEVVINSGVTLTIDNNATIQFADSKLVGIPTGITVNQGGHLVVNTGILTSIINCPMGMWDGVIVIGNPSTLQNTTQGIVFMTGTITHPSTISNARTGLLLGYNGSGHFSPPRGGGSYAECTNVLFLNNNIDVQTVPYLTPSPGNSNANRTFFTNCTFTSNQLLNDPSYVDALGLPRTTLEHVYLNGVKGINFNNCNFSTNIASIITDDRSIGIYSTDAMFTITGPNPIPATPTNTFQNLRYGIYATATNASNTFGVSYTNFTNCFASIYQSNIDYSNVIFNQFQITAAISGLTNTKACHFNPTISNCRQYFYYLNQCNGYIHQENSYAVTVSGQSVYGTVFNNSVGSSNLTYRNTYSGVTVGTQAQAGNGSLHIECNTFLAPVSITSDISITSGLIASPQGNCSPGVPAGNIFDHSASDILVSLPASSFVYNYFSDAADMPNTTSNYVPTPCGSPRPVGACPTNYPPPPVNPCASNPSACRLAVVDSLNQVITSMEVPLKQGEAADLYNKINSVTAANINNPNKITNVENALLSKSPYLSDSVLLTLLRHTPEFPQNAIAAIIIANSPVSTPVLTVVDSLALSSSIQTQINSAQVGVSARAQLMEQLKALFYDKENELNLAISEILLINPGPNADVRVENLLAKDSTIDAKIELVYFATADGDNSVAQQMIDSIASMPSKAKIAQMQQYGLNVTQSGQTWAAAMQSNPAMQATIMTIAADSTQQGYAAAGAALTSAYSMPGYEYIEGLQSESESRMAANKTSNTNSGASMLAMNTNLSNKINSSYTDLRAYPNPTNGMLNVEYSITDPTCTEATLQLVEMGTGRILANKIVPCNSTSSQIDMNELANGVYSLSIQSNLNAPKILRVVKVQ